LLRWLHLSDLHLGRHENTHQENGLSLLVTDVREHWPWDRCDVIVLTGDLAWSGSSAEYERLWKLVIEPLREDGRFATAEIICVPGNHDLDCDSGMPITWEGIGARRQSEFFQETDAGQRVRGAKAAGFVEFERFLDERSLLGPRPGREVTSYHDIPQEEGVVRFVATNTAFFCDKEPDFQEEGVLPAPTASLRQFIQEDVLHTFVLGHHPHSWFVHAHKEPFKRAMRDAKATYLHGHTHQVEAHIGGHGLWSLGFGAAYQASPDSSPDPYYRNSYAICLYDPEGIHIYVRSWHSANGAWAEEVELPSEFTHRSSKTDGYVFPVGLGPTSRGGGASQFVPRPPLPVGVYPLGSPSAEECTAFLNALLPRRGYPKPETRLTVDSAPKGQFKFFYGSEPAHRFWMIAQPGHILSRSMVEEINNEIDYEGFVSSTLITFGELAEDARTSYIKLKDSKPLKIVDGHKLVEAVLAVAQAGLKTRLAELDGSQLDAEFLWSGGEFALLCLNRQTKGNFFIIGPGGDTLGEADELVLSMRRLRPTLRELHYGETTTESGPADVPDEFDRVAFLERCRAEFDSVKYAALAHTGLRLSSLSLSQLYIQASGEVEDQPRSSLRSALQDLVDGLPVGYDIGRQLEAYARRAMGVGSAAETGAARRLYQRHSNVLVLGDPGSGKSCFAKSEALAYCNPPPDSGGWYAKHTPIYVPLIDAVRYLRADREIDILTVCSRTLARQGLEMGAAQLQELVDDGLAAFFFDGLDEISSVPDRSTMVNAIGELMDRAIPRGCRFVLCSRPAATRVVDIPKHLRQLHLKGLTHGEMRQLAERIIAAQGVGLDALLGGKTSLREEDAALVDKLMSDTETVPGISKLARNPLLFTLLVLIYWNSGPPAARRHRIYQQAVQSLVSVRSRQAGQRLFSEADLRKRLGALALYVFRDREGLLPTFGEATSVLRGVMVEQRGREVTDDEVQSFIQEVAEATGLLVLHEPHGEDQEGVVSFMHHSFMEYYAAVGLLETGDWEKRCVELSQSPRWQAVISLLAGIHADQSDVTPFIAELLESAEPPDRYTLRRLEFAFDCALESEVPPEATVEMLVNGAIAGFPLQLANDVGLVRRVGGRLGELFGRTSSTILTDAILTGLDGSGARRQLCLEYIGYLGREGDIPERVLQAFVAACDKPSSGDTVAICRAVGAAPPLRVPSTIAVVKAALGGNVKERIAASRAVELAPSLVRGMWKEVVDCTKDRNPSVALSSASAVMAAGVVMNPRVVSDRSLIRPALEAIHAHASSETFGTYGVSAQADQVRTLLDDLEFEVRMVGLLLLPWVEDTEFVYMSVMNTVRHSTDEREAIAALSTLRLSSSTHKLLKMVDEDVILTLLASGTRDVRAAVLKFLRVTGTQRTLAAVMEIAHEESAGPGYRTAIEALGGYGDRVEVQEFLVGELQSLARSSKWSPKVQKDYLSVCSAISGFGEIPAGVQNTLDSCLTGLIGSFKAPDDVRAGTLHAFAAVGSPSTSSFAFWLDVLKSPPVVKPSAAGATGTTLEADVARALAAFLERISSDIEAIRTAQRHVESFEVAVVAALDSTGASRDRGPALRQVLDEVSRLRTSYESFSLRMMADGHHETEEHDERPPP